MIFRDKPFEDFGIINMLKNLFVVLCVHLELIIMFVVLKYLQDGECFWEII